MTFQIRGCTQFDGNGKLIFSHPHIFSSTRLHYSWLLKGNNIHKSAYLSSKKGTSGVDERKFLDSSINRHDFATKTRNDSLSKWKATKFKSISCRRVLYSSHVKRKGAESGNAFLREAFILFSPAFAFSSIFSCLYFTFFFPLKTPSCNLPTSETILNLHGYKRLESAFVKREKHTNCKSCQQTYIHFGVQLRQRIGSFSLAFRHYRISKICRWIVHSF